MKRTGGSFLGRIVSAMYFFLLPEKKMCPVGTSTEYDSRFLVEYVRRRLEYCTGPGRCLAEIFSAIDFVGLVGTLASSHSTDDVVD